MAESNPYLCSQVLSSTVLGRYPASRTVYYLQSRSNTTPEPYISLPMPFPSDYPLDVSSDDDILSLLRRDREEESEKWELEGAIASTDLCGAKARNNRNSLQELSKELQECNPLMMNNPAQQIQFQRLSGTDMQIPRQKTRVLVHEQGDQLETSTPLLDGSICSQRLKQYLYHMRNNNHDNGISYWKEFVSEYYAPGSKKRWCFSNYENIELHTASVFCSKSTETYCCEICGLKSGKGLEATSEVFPRLFKVQYESGMLDEILHIDSPRVCKFPHGLVLEYGKAVQASVYQTVRVVHNGKLRVVFGHDLKILSWEFCIENHEEYLLRSLFTPQVKQLVHAVEKYQGIENRARSRASLLDLQKFCDTCVAAGNQMARNTELPLVSDLGYPKRFIRCLQISEVVDSMKDLMTLSRDTKAGAIECLSNYSKERRIRRGRNSAALIYKRPNHANVRWMNEKGEISSEVAESNLSFHQLLGQSSDCSNREIGFGSRLDQALVDRMLLEMVAATRGESKRPNFEAAQQSRSKKLRSSESSEARVNSRSSLTGAAAAAAAASFLGYRW